MKAVLQRIIITCGLWVLAAHPSFALNEPSHALVNEQASRRSNLDTVLKEQLGFDDGIDQKFRGAAVFEWVREGGVREDDGSYFEYLMGKSRPFRHFHDPLRLWDRSGLLLPPRLTRFESSIRWAQRKDQDQETGYGNYSWPHARRYYLNALTDPDSTARERAFADTFRALGQVMHLIVDASVPEHVRNDPHPMGTILDKVGQVGNYEYWVLAQHRRTGTQPRFIQEFLSPFVTPDPKLLEFAPSVTETVARVPIAGLFDTDRYTGQNPWVTAEADIGIAEIANANFISENRGPREYPHPALANIQKYIGAYSKTGEKRAYYMKPGVGLLVNPVATECALEELIGVQTLCVDDDVWRETARKMLPRAVGYSAALLDYFFRGTLDFTVDNNPQDPTQRRLIITNASSSGETMDGTFTLHYEDKDGKRSDVPGASTTQALGLGYSADLTFTPPTGVQAYVLVFQGTLGAEEGAVAGKVKPWEPPIFVIQEFAELTGPEKVETHDWCVEADTGELCPGWSESAANIRYKDPRLQRAGGTFQAADGSGVGEFIKRVVLETGAPPPADQGIALRLNGETIAGREWSREKGPAMVPKTWEIVVDLTQLPDSYGLIGPPMLLVETQSGIQQWTSPVWWMQNKAAGDAWVQVCYDGCCPRPLSVLVVSSTSAWNEVVVSFGGDFIPVQGIGGFEVGTYIDAGGLSNSPEACPAQESTSDQYVAIFVDQFQKPTNRAGVSRGQSARRWIDEANRSAYARPPGSPPEAPPLVQALTFRRQYSPYELEFYQRLGITPPEYEIELR